MYEITQFMTQEHSRLALLFREYQTLKGEAPDRARRRLKKFIAGLERHMTLEEEILFPRFEAVSRLGNSGPTTVMRSEHREIREALARLLAESGAAGAAERIEDALLESLRAHEAMEDLVFSPWIDESLSENERLGLFEQIRHFPAAPA
jgi:hemerythrin-like domain-containing protein